MPIPKQDPNATTAIDTVFEKLLSDIVSGVHRLARGCPPSASYRVSSRIAAHPA